MDVLLGLGSAVPSWLHEALWALRHLLSSACTRRTRAHLCQGDSEPPRGLAFERRQASTQRLTSRVEGLGQPGAPLGPFPCGRAEGRLPQDPAEGLPHPLVHRRRGGLARWAARAAGDPPRLRPPPTAVIRGTGGHGATAAGASPWATAEQAAASLRLRRLMAAGQGHVTLHAGLGRVAGRRADEGRHRHGGWARASRRGAGPAPGGASRGGRRAPQAPSRGALPAVSTPGRGERGRAEALGDWRPAGRLSGGGLPGNHGLHHGSWDRVKAPAAGIPRTVGRKASAGGRAGPRPPRATAARGLAAPSPALGTPGPLVLGHGRAAVSPPLRMRSIMQRPLDTRDATAPWGACLDQAPLRDIVARATLRGGDAPTGQGGQGRPRAASSQRGALACGAPRAVSPGAGPVGHRPIGVRRPGIVATPEWLCTRLGLWVTRRGNPAGESDGQGTPPEEALRQDGCLRRVPSPMAEGTGRHHPTVVPRQAGPPSRGTPARAAADVPPASMQSGRQEEIAGRAPQPCQSWDARLCVF